MILDRYVHPAPAEGWPRWMERNLDAAQFVLMVCTETYRRRVMGEEEPGQGLGVHWEGKLIYNRIYLRRQPSGSRFIPILLPGSEPAHIPDPVRGHTHYQIATFDLTDPGFEALYRHLTDQPATPRPDLGSIQILPPKPRPQAVPGPLPPSGGPWWNVPYPRNPDFTGREAILAQLEAALASGTPAALSQAIAGLGGVGKTQTAVEYAYRHRDQYRAVLWVRADTETSLASGYRELAEVLGLPEKDESDSNKVVAAVRRWLGREPGYLLILDNADDPALVKPYLPPDPKGHVLLTSRAHNFDVLGIRKPIELPVLTPDEALEFLLKRTGREGPLDPAEQDAARTLAEELGYLPLALEQAAAYMVEHEEAFSVYLAAYRALRLKLLDEMGPVAGEYPETVRTTWKRSFDAVAAASPASIALLRLSAFFAPDAIPYELILEGASELGEPLASALASPPGGDHALNELLTPLARHSLVRRDPEARTYSVHRLVQAVLLDELTAATRKDLAERAVKALNRTFPDVEYANWPRCERLVPHALAARGWIESEDLRVPEAVRLLNKAGWYLYDRARYAEAEPLYRQVLAIREQAMGPDHPDTALSLNDLGVMILAQDRYAEAEPLFRRALAIREAVLGPDHPDTATSLNNLAVLLRDQGRYGEAEPLFRRALAIREAVLGPDHPDTAISLNNLALLLQAQGRYGEAEPLFRRALAIREEALGPDHPDTARSLNNLARLLRAQGRPEEASRCSAGRWRSARRRWARTTPTRPPASTTWRSCSGPRAGPGRRSRCSAGRWRSARRRWARTTPTRPPASTTWRCCSGAQGRSGEAEPLLPPGAGDPRGGAGPRPPRHGHRASTTWRSCSGPRAGTGRRSRCYRRALAIREEALGPDHPDTAHSLNNLAELLRAQGRPGRRSRCSAGRWRSARRRWAPTTPTRPRASTTWRSCSGPRAGTGRRSRCYRRALAIREAALGPDHPDTANSLNNLARLLQAQGRYGEAEPLLRRALAIFEATLGPEHP